VARFSLTRDGIEVHHFHLVATIGVPLLALFLQATLPRILGLFSLLDLPLLVTVFFAVARRNPILGTTTGALIGLVQDALTHLPLGLFGIAKTVVGYAASSIGAKIDVENPGSRLLLTFGFYLLHRGVYQLVARSMAQLTVPFSWANELGAALLNAVVAVFLFAILDRTKMRK
jgi:rod shape-determining protein MreD